MNAQLVTWIGELPTWSVRLLFGLTIVWTSAGIAIWVLRRGSAAVRHRTWGLSVVAALVLPLLVWCLPEVRLGWFEAPSGRTEIGSGAVAVVENESARTSMDRVEQPTPDGRPDRTRDGESASAPSIEFVSRTEIPTTESPIIELKSLQLTPSQTEPTSAASSNPLAFAGIGGWWLIALCAPAFWGLFQILRSLRVAGRIVARSEEITDPICRQLLAGVAGVQAAGVQASACANGGSQNKLHPSSESRGAFDIASQPQNGEIAASVGLRSLKAELQLAELQRLQLRQSADTPVPLCVGLRKPSIILPADWRTWPNETLQAALAHELSHVLRHDVAWQLLARLACAVYWFHPLAWLAARRMRIERETACDDSVLRAGQQPAAYARVLVAVAEWLMFAATPGVAAVAMAERAGLEQRVKSILEPGRSRRPVGRRLGRWLLGAALVLALGAAVFNPLSRDGEANSPQQSRWFTPIVGLLQWKTPKPDAPPPDPWAKVLENIRRDERNYRQKTETKWRTFREFSVRVIDEKGGPVDAFELRICPTSGGDTGWKRGVAGEMKVSSRVPKGDALDINVRSDGFASTFVRFADADRDELLAGKTTIRLRRGEPAELKFHLPEGLSWPAEFVPDVYSESIRDRVRMLWYSETRRNYAAHGLSTKFHALPLTKTGESTFSLRVSAEEEPFFVSIHHPGFLQFFECGPFRAADFEDGVLDIPVPRPATLNVAFDYGSASLKSLPFETMSLQVWYTSPGAKSIYSVGRESFDARIPPLQYSDLAPAGYRIVVTTGKESGPTTPSNPGPPRFHDLQRVTLGPGENQQVKFEYRAFDVNAFRGRRTAKIRVMNPDGTPAVGRNAFVSYWFEHYGYRPVFQGTTSKNGEIEVPGLTDRVPSLSEVEAFTVSIDDRTIGRFHFGGGPTSERFEFRLRPDVGDLVPNIDFVNIDTGKRTQLQDLRGKIVCLEFWATWCGPCQPAMEKLNEIVQGNRQRWGDRVAVVPLSIDDRPETVSRQTKLRSWTQVEHYWSGADGKTDFDSPAVKALGIEGVPTAVLIDRNGRVAWRGHPGEDLEARIDEALGK